MYGKQRLILLDCSERRKTRAKQKELLHSCITGSF